MSEMSVRQPVVAGQFYPAQRDQLEREVCRYISSASVPAELGTVRAVIAPHAGYVYSGTTAGYAFKSLEQHSSKKCTVFLMGPAHRVPVNGVALGDYSALRTPLGEAPVAVERVQEMLERSSLYTRAPEAHAPEHSLEVAVPFLQIALSDFQLIPMLFGQADPRKVGDDLAVRVGKDDLIVVSSDLSHFYPDNAARELDHVFLDAVLNSNEREAMKGEACGLAPVRALMRVAERRGWRPHLLDYRTSADTAGDTSRVVGYAALAYTKCDSSVRKG